MVRTFVPAKRESSISEHQTAIICLTFISVGDLEISDMSSNVIPKERRLRTETRRPSGDCSLISASISAKDIKNNSGVF